MGVFMRWSGTSYNGDRYPRQSPFQIRPLATILLAATLGGCSGLGMPFGEVAMDRELTTGSLHKVSTRGQDKVDQSDWETVRRTIASVAAESHPAANVAWSNPDTGNTGTITIHDTITGTNDPNCRNFATTLNDPRGIRHYRGETCHMNDNRWQLFGVLADDSKLL
jgi:surface antigen